MPSLILVDFYMCNKWVWRVFWPSSKFIRIYSTSHDTYLLKRGTTWNDLQRARKNLKQPRTSKKRPEMTYNKQETTWNNLERVRNDLEQPTTRKKWLETTYNEQETTWNNLEWARNDMKRPTVSKKWPETTCKEQMLTGGLQCHKEAIDQFPVCTISYHLCIREMMTDRKIKANVRTKRSKGKQNWIITWLVGSLV